MVGPQPADLLVAETTRMLPKLTAALAPHAVHAVHHVDAAKAALGEMAFDMVILGAHIERGAMLEVLRFAAAHERLRATPIVCIRTQDLWSPLPGLARTAKALGADALLDFLAYPNEKAALDALARLVGDYIHCGVPEPQDQIWLSLDSAVAHFTADFGLVHAYDPEGRRLRVVAQRNCSPRLLSSLEASAEASAACGTAMKRRQRVVVGDVATDPLFADGESRRVLLESGVAALHATPLFSRPARLRGMLTLHYRSAQRPSDAQLAYADILARRMAGSLSLM